MSSRISIVRDSVVRIVKMLTEKRVQVTQRGSTAYVTYNHDGTPAVVNIPYIPDDASEELLMATQGFLDHEVAHVLFTDYEAVAKANKEGYGQLHNIIEDSFIERKMAEQFAGSGHNLAEMGQYFLTNYTDQKLKTLKAGDPQIDGLLIVPAIRAWAGQRVFQDYMKVGDKWSMIKKVVDRLDPVKHKVAAITNSMQAAALAKEMKELLELPDEVTPPPPTLSKRPTSGAKKHERKVGERPSAATGGAGGAAGEIEEGPGMGTGAVAEGEPSSPEYDDEDEGDEEDPDAVGEGAGDDDEEEDEAETDPDEDEGAAAGGGGSGGSAGGGAAAATGGMYEAMESSIKDFDEGLSELISKKAIKEIEKSEYKVYTRDMDQVIPLEIPKTFKDTELRAMQEAIDHMVGPLQKDFERAIAAKSASTWSGGHRSGRLHSASLSRLALSDDRIFRRKHINNGKDVAVELLVDCSGSMGSYGKIEAAAYAAYALSSVLDRMNIANEVLGFTTRRDMPREMYSEEEKLGIRYARTQALYMPILKGFNERLSVDNKRRFASLASAAWLRENVDGECVQIAAQRLAQRREKRKVMFVFSDGQPACPGDHKSQVRHLKRTVAEVERSGIEIMGIGIADDSAKQYYTRHVLLTSISDLPTTVIGQIKKILMQ